MPLRNTSVKLLRVPKVLLSLLLRLLLDSHNVGLEVTVNLVAMEAVMEVVSADLTMVTEEVDSMTEEVTEVDSAIEAVIDVAHPVMAQLISSQLPTSMSETCSLMLLPLISRESLDNSERLQDHLSPPMIGA